MAQVYAAVGAPAESWLLLGTETARTVMLATSTSVTYNTGSPDTLPALTPAIVDGGSATTFDGTTGVYVAYTVQGSGVLRLAPEAALPSTGTYALLARVLLHQVVPYQQS